MPKYIFKLALLLFSINALGQSANRGDVRLALDPAVRTGRLANGFTYFIRHNEEPKNRVELYLVNKVGSVLEDEDQRGLAHFMEHMNFNGTRHFPKNELVDYLQRSGIRFGADLNAYTGFDETVYQLPLPSDRPELLLSGFDIMHDWAQFATLDPAEIDRERGVVLEEKRLGKGAGERMQRQYWPMLLNYSRYAVRIPIGLDTVLNNFKRSSIKRFYQDWYRPDLQALIVVGDIDVNAAEQIIKKRFADLKNPTHERLRPAYAVPLTGKNQFMAVTDKEMTGTNAEVIIKHKATVLRTAIDYRKVIMENLFNQMMGERMGECIRQANPPFAQGSIGIGSFIGGLNVYDASVVSLPGELERGFKTVWRENERMRRFGFTSSELARAKQAYFARMETALKERRKTPSVRFVKEYQDYFLKHTAAPGIEKEYELTAKYLPGISLADMMFLVKSHFTSNNRDILILAPEMDKPDLPDGATVNRWMKEVAAETLQPFEDKVSSDPLLAAAPVSGKTTAEQHDDLLGTTTLTFSNGLKVVLKPTAFKDNEILFSGFAPGGASLYNDADYQSAVNAVAVVTSGGTGNYNLTQLSKFMTDKQASVSPFIGERFEGFNGAATPKDLETALQLVYAYFTAPRRDIAIFNAIIARSKVALANRNDDPGSFFNDAIAATLYNNNVRKTGPSLEKLAQIDLDKAYSIFRERFSDASNFTFVFTGNLDTATVIPLLEKYLGGLPSSQIHERAIDRAIPIVSGKIIKTVYKGSEPKSTVMLLYSGDFDYSLASKIRLDALKECLEIRLLQRLREEEGGVYSPSAQLVTEKLPGGSYQLYVRFGCAPENVERLIASVTNEVNKLRTQGPSVENLNKWRNEDETLTETNLRTNGFWLNYLTGMLQNDEDLHQIDRYRHLRESVTVRDIQETASRYLNENNFIRIVLMPEYMAKQTNPQ